MKDFSLRKTRWLNPTIKGKVLTFLCCLMVVSQAIAQKQITVNGTVVDENGAPLIGATVVIEGKQTGTIAGAGGKFSLAVPSNAKLSVSFVGYITQSVPVNEQTTISVVLKENSNTMDEIVVIGYQTVKRKDLTGSVSSVSGKDIAAIPASNAAQAMQGQLPGVNVTTQDGRPGASVSIRIRGGGSISQSNDPLILVDGVVVSNLSDVPGDLVESIDVLKDASSTAIYGSRGANGVILVTTKGAKEGKTTITYSGFGKFNEPIGYTQALDPYDYLVSTWSNTKRFGDAYRIPFEKLYGIGDNKGNNTGGIESYRNMATDDIQKKVYNSSFSQNHDLSITGGTNKTKVLLGLNYLDDQGMKVNSFLKRTNISFKVNQKLLDNLDFSLDTRYAELQSMSGESTSSGTGSILSSAYRFRPIATDHILGDLGALREGNIDMFGKGSQWDSYSPASRNEDYEPLLINQILNNTAGLNWKVFNGLVFHSELAMRRSWNQTKTWSGAIYNNYIDDATGEKTFAGNAVYKKDDSWETRWANTLNYNVSFTENHRLNILVGQEVSNSGGTKFGMDASYFPANYTKDNAFAMIGQYDKTKNVFIPSSGVTTPVRVVSFFGRANYTLFGKYTLTGTFRADGSSKFSPEHNWGYFPAGAVAWRLSEEPFIKNIQLIDNLKVRASYGQVGNDGINSDLWSQTWNSVSDLNYQHIMGQNYSPAYTFTTATMPNRDLKWETTITRGIGVDFGLFKNRLSGSVDLYKNTTKDLLMLTAIPGITGYTQTYANVGQTSNKGIEVALSAMVFSSKDLSISVGGNINFNKGNVDQLANNVSGVYSSQWSGTNIYPKNDYILREGSPVGIVRGFVYDGFYTTDDFTYDGSKYTLKKGIPDLGNFLGTAQGLSSGANDRPSGQIAYPGMIKFKKLDGTLNPDGSAKPIGDDDVTDIGNMAPIHTGGFNINTKYKGFDFGIFFTWSYGNQIYNANKLATLMGGKEAAVYQNKLAMMKDAYKIYDVDENGLLQRLYSPEELNAANVNAKYPMAIQEYGITSSIGIEDGSYLRLNTLTLGYTIPKRFVNKVGISNLRIYATATNLITLTGYSGLDPEVNTNINQNKQAYPTLGLDWGSYPRARSIVAGINLSF